MNILDNDDRPWGGQGRGPMTARMLSRLQPIKGLSAGTQVGNMTRAGGQRGYSTQYTVQYTERIQYMRC